MTLLLRPTGADELKVISDRDLSQWIRVAEDALFVHLDREKIRHGLWKEHPPEDQNNQIITKSDRVRRTLELIANPTLALPPDQVDAMKENAVSELHDVINYAIFAVRQLDGTA